MVAGRELPDAPGTGQRRAYGYTAAAQEEHAYQGIRTMKAESPPGDHPQLVVEAFNDPVGEPGFDVGEDAVLVFPDSSSGLYEGSELGAGGPGEPAVQFLECGVFGGLFEDGREGFLEQVGAVQRGVVFLDRGELIPLLGGEVPWVFEQGVSGLLDRGGLLGIVALLEAADFVPAYLVDSLRSELEDVKEVKDDLRIWRLGLYGLDESGGHVDGDELDLACPVFSELIEESVERLGALALGSPDDAVFIMVDDSSDVAVPFAKAELIDADALEAVEPMGVELVGDNALYDIAYGPPRDAHHPGHFGLVGDLGEVGGHLFKVPGEAAIGPGPGNQFDTNTAAGTLHAPWNVFDDDPDRADTEVDPAHRFVPVVIAGTDLVAARAAWDLPRRPHPNDKRQTIKIEPFDEKTGNPDQFSDKLVGAHVFLPAFRALLQTPESR